MADKLKECPFCGLDEAIARKDLSSTGFTVTCSCAASTWDITKDEAVAAWNRRTTKTTRALIAGGETKEPSK